MKKIFSPAVIALILGFFIFNLLAVGADFPTKPITIIVTVSPGGTVDLQARAFATVAEKMLKQPIVAINNSTASGMLGLMQGLRLLLTVTP